MRCFRSADAELVEPLAALSLRAGRAPRRVEFPPAVSRAASPDRQESRLSRRTNGRGCCCAGGGGAGRAGGKGRTDGARGRLTAARLTSRPAEPGPRGWYGLLLSSRRGFLTRLGGCPLRRPGDRPRRPPGMSPQGPPVEVHVTDRSLVSPPSRPRSRKQRTMRNASLAALPGDAGLGERASLTKNRSEAGLASRSSKNVCKEFKARPLKTYAEHSNQLLIMSLPWKLALTQINHGEHAVSFLCVFSQDSLFYKKRQRQRKPRSFFPLCITFVFLTKLPFHKGSVCTMQV